jgi:predicted outer membrane repeat protein
MANYIVTTLADVEDGSDGVLSLREALALANGNAESDDVTFAAALAGGTLFLTNGQLSITTDGISVDGDIDGNGTADITIDADSAAGLNDAASRIFFISDGSVDTISAALTGLAIQDGSVVGDGGGIYVGRSDVLTLTNVTVSGNSAGENGGGIFGYAGAGIVLTNATVSGNSAGEDGGGIYADTGTATTLTNTTVTGNSAGEDGGGIYCSTGTTITLTNSIAAGNAAAGAGDDLYGGGSQLEFTGGNIIGSTPAGFGVTGAPTQIDGTNQAELETVFAAVANNPDTGVLSGVLADNGGGIKTVAIEQGGIAHNAGNNGVLPADPQDLDGDGNVAEPLPVDARGGARVNGVNVDIGAVELQAVPQALVVTTLDDETFGGGDILIETADGNGLSLREALGLADGAPDANEITFAAALAGGTLFLTNGELRITTDGIIVDGDIDGNGVADIAVSADSAPGANDATSSVFSISDGAFSTISAALNGLIIRDGVAAFGGGVSVGRYDALTLTHSTVSGNDALYGGGIFGDDDAAITLTNSTVSGNSADSDGGGIFGDVDTAITLTNATISGNSAGENGGGIYGLNDNEITLINSTVTGNSAGENGGGIYNIDVDGITTLVNSIVAGNAAADAGDDLFGGVNSSADLVFTGGNIIGSAPANFASVTGAPTAQIDGTNQAALETVFAAVANDPDTGVLSGVLADNGGGVATVALRPAGIAHNAGDDGVLPADTQDLDGDGDVAEPLPVDARGLPRSFGVSVDIGAFEIQLGLPTDLNGDFHSDILWRNEVGTVALWEMNGVDVLSNQGIATIPTYWHIIDADGDFDGDGMSDILWRDDAGIIVLWTMDGPAILTNTAITGTLDFAAIPDFWHIEDTGDFTGDGRADVLWRDDAGRVVLWEMDGADIVSNSLVADVPTTSQIEDTADFTGDGRNDILWRDDDGSIRLWEMNGANLVANTVVATVPDDLRFADTGDFNGDTRSDILWRDGAGTVVLWEMNGPAILTNTPSARCRTTGTSPTPAITPATSTTTSCGAIRPVRSCCGR